MPSTRRRKNPRFLCNARVNTLQSKHLTKAQKSEFVHYEPGDVVEFVTRGKGGFKAGDRLEVTAVKDGEVFSARNGQSVQIPLSSPGSFEVYRQVQLGFAAGDQIRITKNKRARNSQEKRLNNGTLVELKGFTKDGQLKLTNGQTLAADWLHIDHGIVLTSYSSQGKTYDRVLVAQSHFSFPASSPEQLYVTASRARESMMIYSDNRAELAAAVSQQRPTLNAMDLLPESKRLEAKPLSRTLLQQAEHIRLHVKMFAQKQFERLSAWAKHQIHLEVTR